MRTSEARWLRELIERRQSQFMPDTTGNETVWTRETNPQLTEMDQFLVERFRATSEPHTCISQAELAAEMEGWRRAGGVIEPTRPQVLTVRRRIRLHKASDIARLKGGGLMIGRGKYDAIATAVMEQTRADCVVLIVINGNEGHGFAVQGDLESIRAVAKALPTIASEMLADVKKEERSK